MRKKMFLTGIIGLALIFILGFSGCKSDDDGGGGNNNNSGGGDNSLLGTWVNDLNVTNNLWAAIIFSDYTVPGSDAKLVYYGNPLASTGEQRFSGADPVIPIGASAPQGAKEYKVDSKTADQFILKEYGPNDATTNLPTDVTFKRASGTNGSDYRGIWISDTTNISAYTILVIGGTSGQKVWSAHGGNAVVANYKVSVDPGSGKTVISWNGNNSIDYTKEQIGGNINLSITPPGAAGPLPFSQYKTTPTF